jgi:hypothetical protein
MPRKTKYEEISDEMMDSLLDQLRRLPAEEGEARLKALATYSSAPATICQNFDSSS